MNFAILMRKKQEQMHIMQILANFILKWFKKKGTFWAEKKVLRSAKVVASAAASWCRKNGWKAYRTLTTATLRGSFELGHILLPKMQLSVPKAGAVAFCGHSWAFYRAFCQATEQANGWNAAK